MCEGFITFNRFYFKIPSRTDWETVVKEYNCPPCGEKESIEETAKRKCHSNSLHRKCLLKI